MLQFRNVHYTQKKELSFIIRLCLKFLKFPGGPQITLDVASSNTRENGGKLCSVCISQSNDRDRKELEVEKQNNAKAIEWGY